MLEAGAHPGDLLFKGQISDGQISGTAYIFNAQCGKVPFHVKGPILDNGGRIVLTGQAPRMGRNCQTYGDYASTLEFKLLKTAEITQPPSVLGQTPSAEEPTPASLSSDVGEPKLPDAAQPPPAKQTLTTEEPNPKVPSNAVSDTKPAGNRSIQAPSAAQPRSKQESKSEAAEAGEKEASTLSAPRSRTASAPASPQRSTEKNLLAPVIIALNGALPLLSILFLIMMLRSGPSGVT
jgi:hypothetical protein